MTRLHLLELLHADRRGIQGELLLQDISLRIGIGERIALQGPSGSGKSLLLRSLAGLEPTTGELRFLGNPIPAAEVPRFRGQVIYLAQSPVFPLGRVEDALREPFSWASHADQAFERKVAVTIVEKLGKKATFLDKHTSELSGGEAGIGALVRALLLKPRVLLLDEPTSALDAEATGQFESCVADWAASHHGTYVWATHQVEQVGRVAARSIALQAGRIVEDERIL